MADTYAGEDANAKTGIDDAAKAEERLTASTANAIVEKKDPITSGWEKPPLAKRGSGNQLPRNGKVTTTAAMMGTCHRYNYQT